MENRSTLEGEAVFPLIWKRRQNSTTGGAVLLPWNSSRGGAIIIDSTFFSVEGCKHITHNGAEEPQVWPTYQLVYKPLGDLVGMKYL